MAKVKTLIVAVAGTMALAMSSAAIAEEKKAQGSGPSPFTECGIGAALFPNTSWAAVTSNVIWDIGTTAVISATASPETCNGKSVKAARFINDTFDKVLEDTAMGDGEYVATLLQIYGCESNSHNSIINAVRSDIAEIVGDDSYGQMQQVQKAEAYFNIIDAEVKGTSALSCSA